jgi:hypothetical protein
MVLRTYNTYFSYSSTGLQGNKRGGMAGVCSKLFLAGGEIWGLKFKESCG